MTKQITHRNPVAKALKSQSCRARVVAAKRGKGSYKRQSFKKF
jgi:stalled ribosome alternative rescue factor ArfA